MGRTVIFSCCVEHYGLNFGQTRVTSLMFSRFCEKTLLFPKIISPIAIISYFDINIYIFIGMIFLIITWANQNVIFFSRFVSKYGWKMIKIILKNHQFKKKWKKNCPKTKALLATPLNNNLKVTNAYSIIWIF